MRARLMVAAMVLLSASGASAQVRPGLNELNGSGSITGTSYEGETYTVSQAELRIGHFLDRHVELGGALGVAKYEGMDAFGSAGAFAAYHFGAAEARTVPYLGGAGELGFGSGDDKPVTYGGFAGMKFFVAEGAALSTEAFLNRTREGDYHHSTYGVRAGISIFF